MLEKEALDELKEVAEEPKIAENSHEIGEDD
jgi:hypothetical protein